MICKYAGGAAAFAIAGVPGGRPQFSQGQPRAADIQSGHDAHCMRLAKSLPEPGKDQNRVKVAHSSSSGATSSLVGCDVMHACG